MKVGDKYQDRAFGVIYKVITWGDSGVSLESEGNNKLVISHARLKSEFKKI